MRLQELCGIESSSWNFPKYMVYDCIKRTLMLAYLTSSRNCPKVCFQDTIKDPHQRPNHRSLNFPTLLTFWMRYVKPASNGERLRVSLPLMKPAGLYSYRTTFLSFKKCHRMFSQALKLPQPRRTSVQPAFNDTVVNWNGLQERFNTNKPNVEDCRM